MTIKAESEIFKAFDLIHSLDVVHGDIRPENILIADDGYKVWIVDFEFAEIMEKGDDARELKISLENQAVKEVLKEFKRGSSENIKVTVSQNGAGIS